MGRGNSFERQARSSGLVLGRKTYEGLAGYWPSQSGKWADMGTVRMELDDDVKQFDSGVVLLTYLPAS